MDGLIDFFALIFLDLIISVLMLIEQLCFQKLGSPYVILWDLAELEVKVVPENFGALDLVLLDVDGSHGRHVCK